MISAHKLIKDDIKVPETWLKEGVQRTEVLSDLWNYHIRGKYKSAILSDSYLLPKSLLVLNKLERNF